MTSYTLKRYFAKHDRLRKSSCFDWTLNSMPTSSTMSVSHEQNFGLTTRKMEKRNPVVPASLALTCFAVLHYFLLFR